MSNASTALDVTTPGPAGSVRTHLQPLLHSLGRNRIRYALDVEVYASYAERSARFPDYPVSGGSVSTWLITRATMLAPAPSAVPAALVKLQPGRRCRNQVWHGGRRPTDTAIASSSSSSSSFSSSHFPASPAAAALDGSRGDHSSTVASLLNSVQTVLRVIVAMAFVYTAAHWGDNAPQAYARQVAFMNEVVNPTLVALAPRSAPYLNKASAYLLNLVRVTFGPHLARLHRFKTTENADNVFTAPGGVSSNEWTEDKEGRLCKFKWMGMVL